MEERDKLVRNLWLIVGLGILMGATGTTCVYHFTGWKLTVSLLVFLPALSLCYLLIIRIKVRLEELITQEVVLYAFYEEREVEKLKEAELNRKSS